MPSADFCSITFKVAPKSAIGFHHIRFFVLMRPKDQGTCIPEPDWLFTDRLLSRSPEAGPTQNKDVNFPCTAASFTVAVKSHGFDVFGHLASSLRLI
jgi:hypothetical protein